MCSCLKVRDNISKGVSKWPLPPSPPRIGLNIIHEQTLPTCMAFENTSYFLPHLRKPFKANNNWKKVFVRPLSELFGGKLSVSGLLLLSRILKQYKYLNFQTNKKKRFLSRIIKIFVSISRKDWKKWEFSTNKGKDPGTLRWKLAKSFEKIWNTIILKLHKFLINESDPIVIC